MKNIDKNDTLKAKTSYKIEIDVNFRTNIFTDRPTVDEIKRKIMKSFKKTAEEYNLKSINVKYNQKFKKAVLKFDTPSKSEFEKINTGKITTASTNTQVKTASGTTFLIGLTIGTIFSSLVGYLTLKQVRLSVTGMKEGGTSNIFSDISNLLANAKWLIIILMVGYTYYKFEN